MDKKATKIQDTNTKTFGSKMGVVTGVVITCCLNALIIALAARLVLWII